MTPSFSDFFKSFYYSNTYLPPVDLSDKSLAKHLLRAENQEIASIAEGLISHPEVKAVLAEPLTYELDAALEKNTILEKHGFKLLSSKPNLQTGESVPFYSVIEHDALKGWIIKSGASRIPESGLLQGPSNGREFTFFTAEDSLLRIEMAHRIQKVAQQASIDVVLPKKKLIAYADSEGVVEPTRKYCVVCEKINILSAEDTVQAIKAMDAEQQREIARKISTIVQKAGFADAFFGNIRLTPDKKLTFIDTEPAGLIVAKRPGLKRASVEKCARIGLSNLFNEVSSKPGLGAFCNEVKDLYLKSITTPKLSKWKIVLSIASFGLVPMINVIVALVKAILAKRTYEKLQLIDTVFQVRALSFHAMPLEDQQKLTKEYQEERTPIAEQYFASIEGVP